VTIVVSDNPEQERYEIVVDGELAGFSEYRGHGPVRAFTHTEIQDRFGGQGLATELIRQALDDIRDQGLHILPICPFVKVFLNEHREYLVLVEPRHRVAFNLPEPLEASS
jgi:predicted GNAT family acetyltransferase